MMTLTRHPLALALLLALFAGCSSSSGTSGPEGGDGGLPDANASGGPDAAGDGASRDGAVGPDGASASDGASPLDGATAGDAAADAPVIADGGGSGDAAAPPVDAGYDAPTGPPPPPPTCGEGATWQAGVVLGVSSSLDDELDAITPDELTIVWTEGHGGTATVEYADRAATSDAFGAPQSLPAGEYTEDRVAISPDGLTLVVVNADAQGFSQLSRTARSGAGNTFGSATAGSYSNFTGALGAGESYGDPLLSADDNVFYYSVYGGSSSSTIYRTARLLPTDAWPMGGALAASSGLEAQGSLRRRPTGIASDDQTLFVWDEIMGTERAGFLDASTGVYDTFVDLGVRSMATPNSGCTALYYSAQGASSIDLFVATQ